MVMVKQVPELVDAHGWRIAVQSAPGRGTCFTITIPPLLP